MDDWMRKTGIFFLSGNGGVSVRALGASVMSNDNSFGTFPEVSTTDGGVVTSVTGLSSTNTTTVAITITTTTTTTNDNDNDGKKDDRANLIDGEEAESTRINEEMDTAMVVIQTPKRYQIIGVRW